MKGFMQIAEKKKKKTFKENQKWEPPGAHFKWAKTGPNPWKSYVMLLVVCVSVRVEVIGGVYSIPWWPHMGPKTRMSISFQMPSWTRILKI